MITKQDIKNIITLAEFTCLEGVRHKMLWAIILFAIVLSAANILFTQLFSWDLGKVSVEFGLSTIAFTGLLIVFFLGFKVLSDDLERGRVFMVLARPVTIAQYILGKYLGICLILFVSSAILTIAATCSMSFVIFNHESYVPPNFSWSIYFMAAICQYFQLVILASLAIFCFSASSSLFAAMLITILLYLLGHSIETFKSIIFTNPHAGWLQDQEIVLSCISWLLPNLSLLDKKYIASYGFDFSVSEFTYLITYATSYSILLIFFSILFYKRKQLV